MPDLMLTWNARNSIRCPMCMTILQGDNWTAYRNFLICRCCTGYLTGPVANEIGSRIFDTKDINWTSSHGIMAYCPARHEVPKVAYHLAP